MARTTQTVRVGIYGCGRWANRTRLPNLVKLDGVEIAALCDVDPQALASTAAAFGVSRTYREGHRMLEDESLDALYSLVRAHVRTDVEATAAERGVHLFSEKPQAFHMSVARRIDDAIQRSGVLSTVEQQQLCGRAALGVQAEIHAAGLHRGAQGKALAGQDIPLRVSHAPKVPFPVNARNDPGCSGSPCLR